MITKDQATSCFSWQTIGYLVGAGHKLSSACKEVPAPVHSHIPSSVLSPDPSCRVDGVPTSFQNVFHSSCFPSRA